MPESDIIFSGKYLYSTWRHVATGIRHAHQIIPTFLAVAHDPMCVAAYPALPTPTFILYLPLTDPLWTNSQLGSHLVPYS